MNLPHPSHAAGQVPAHSYTVTRGSTEYPGATPDATGVNFVLSAPDAEQVELCLFDAQDRETRIALFPNRVTNSNGHEKTVWSGHVEGLKEGQHYGYRVHGEYAPHKGRRFNPSKLLVDPYAKAIDGEVRWQGANMAHSGSNNRDSAPYMPRCRVVDWQKLEREQADLVTAEKKPLPDYIICETHVKGATIQNPAVPEELRGTYAGLASDGMIAWLKKEGYNAVELLPVHTFPNDSMLEEKGLKNYWGYMTLGYFAPQAAYAATDKPEEEFAGAVRKLKENGIDVILDVVYNHSCEGNHQGPTLSIRGIDNHLYRLTGDKAHYFDTTGTGNSLDFNHPDARRLVVDSLRHFANMGVAGFRFDLGVALGREGWHGHFNPDAQLFRDINNDPVLKNKTMIWEPWDLGQPDSYQVGHMPRDAQWSGRYRDSIRDFCLSEHGTNIEELALFLAGSSHIFSSPTQSVNFLTAHDGSTLRDLVTYADKHNWENGEQNRDGHGGYRNLGVEGETSDPTINWQRQRLQRFAMATLALSLGAPMVPLGHESGKTQRGNTNVYCQDNPVSWNEWGDQLDARQKDMQDFSSQLFRFRHNHPALRRLSHYTGNINPETGLKDVTWLHPSGREIQTHDWKQEQSLGVLLSGENDRGEKDSPVLMLFNGSNNDREFTLPALPPGIRWNEAIDSSGEERDRRRRPAQTKAGDKVTVPARSVLVYESAAISRRTGTTQSR